MGNEQSLVLQWITLVVVVVLGLFVLFQAPVQVNKVDTAALTTAIIAGLPGVNLTEVEDRLSDIETTLNEEDVWEKEALALATDEWEDRDYKDIYDALVELFEDDEISEIDDRDDIIYVREDKDTEFSEMDVDDKDATVTQYVKVKYEDVTGDNQKVYLTIVTEIEEGEVENQFIDIK